MIILASSSPRRHELLTQIAVPHTVHPAHIDETRRPGEDPMVYVRRLAEEKALAAALHHPAATLLAADTTVVLGAEVLNKPADLADAERMLRSLAGRTHHVHTGLAVVGSGTVQTHVESTAVAFTSIPDDEMAEYLATGDSLDKAGAYGIQGYAARWITRIEGDYFNVVGLPLAMAVRLLRSAGALGPSSHT